MHGTGCVRQWFRTAERLEERRYENWNTHTHMETLSKKVSTGCDYNNRKSGENFVYGWKDEWMQLVSILLIYYARGIFLNIQIKENAMLYFDYMPYYTLSLKQYPKQTIMHWPIF